MTRKEAFMKLTQNLNILFHCYLTTSAMSQQIHCRIPAIQHSYIYECHSHQHCNISQMSAR